MPLIPPGYGQITIVIKRTGDLDPYNCTLGVKIKTGTSPLAQLNKWVPLVKTPMQGNLGASDTLDRIDLAYESAGEIARVTVPVNGAGVLASTTMLPQNCAALIQKSSGQGGRAGRGRMYWPALGEGDVDSIGVLSSTAITRLLGITSAFDSALTSEPLTFESYVILHAAPTPEHPDTPPDPYVIIQWTVSALMATQRRRMRK